MKQLIDTGVYQYPLTQDGLVEATEDARIAALELHKAANRHPSTMYVVKDGSGYYGPINGSKKDKHFAHREVAYIADPAQLTTQQGEA